MSSSKLDPYLAPSPDEFISLFQSDIVNFLQKRIVKDFNHVDLSDLAHDFIAHAIGEKILERYRPDYNSVRVIKLTKELQEKEKEFQIVKRSKHQTKKDLQVLQQLQKEITKKKEKLQRCQEGAQKLVKFKTYLFWCLKSYWWWNIVKMIDIYADEDGVIREHIKTTPQPLLVSQITADDNYKYSDISNFAYLRQEELEYRKDVSRKAAKQYLVGFENFLRPVNDHLASALTMLMSGIEIEDVAKSFQLNANDVLTKLRYYGNRFSVKMGHFGEYLEYV